jgi:hypothetical protein
MRERAAHATLSGHGQSLFVWSDFGQYIFCKSLACMGKNEVALFLAKINISYVQRQLQLERIALVVSAQ